MSDFIVPEGIERLDAFMFGRLKIENLVLPNCVKEIKKAAFKNMPKNVNMPEGYLKQSKGLSLDFVVEALNSVWKTEKTAENCAYLYVNYNDKKSFVTYILPYIEEHIDDCSEFFAEAIKSASKKNRANVVDLVVKKSGMIKRETLKKISQALLEVGATDEYAKLAKNGLIENVTNNK